MIDFACEKISMDEIVKCSFGINKTEYNTLTFLLENDFEGTAMQIAQKMGLERTTIQKAITRLLEKKLAERKQKNLSKGGYVFFYSAAPKPRIKAMLKSTMRDWHDAAEKEIDRF